jgi:hypothetical protein
VIGHLDRTSDSLSILITRGKTTFRLSRPEFEKLCLFWIWDKGRELVVGDGFRDAPDLIDHRLPFTRAKGGELFWGKLQEVH